MSFEVQIQQPIENSWRRARLRGFKLNEKSGTIFAVFKVEGAGENINIVLKNPPQLAEINNIRRPMGLSPITANDKLILPTVGDRDLLGYDKTVDVFITRKDKYYRIKEIRRHRAESQSKNVEQPAAAAAPAASDRPF